VLGACGALLLAAISARIFRRRAVAVATGVAAALHPSFVFLSLEVRSEPLFLVLLLGSGFLLLCAVDRPSGNQALAAGLLLGLAALTRASALALAALLLAPLFDRRYPPRARTSLAAAALCGFLAALAPWTLRNALVFGEVLPVNDAAGYEFYRGNSEWASRFYRISSRRQYDAWSLGLRDALEAEARQLSARDPRPGAVSRGLIARTFAERRRDPGGWTRLAIEKAWHWLRPYPTPWFHPRAAVIAVGALYVVLFGFAAVGLVRAPRPGVRSFALAVLAATMATHVALLVLWRYRVASWDPVLLLYAVSGAARLRT
jgi:hypothetical protein